jgi:hypothetical protein
MTDEEPNAADDEPSPPEPADARGRSPMSRYLPIAAIGIMIATFILIQPTFAMPIIAAAWLVATRVTPSRRLLGLTLTEALAWSATIFIFDFLIALVLFIAGGNLGDY